MEKPKFEGIVPLEDNQPAEEKAKGITELNTGISESDTEKSTGIMELHDNKSQTNSDYKEAIQKPRRQSFEELSRSEIVSENGKERFKSVEKALRQLARRVPTEASPLASKKENELNVEISGAINDLIRRMIEINR